MPKITAILIDDEPQAISALKQEIQLHCANDIEIIGEAKGVEEASKLIKKLKPKLLFLDIQLSGQTGFEILSQTQGLNYNVIFTTAYSEYAIKAIKFSALDYLLKPIDRFELIGAISKLKEQQIEITRDQIEIFSKINLETNHNQKIALNTNEGLKITMLSSIVYLEAEGNYTKVFFEKDKMCLISKTLKEFESQLNSFGFCRIHHSYLVNMEFVELFNSKENFIKLKTEKVLWVSHRRKPILNSYFKNKIL